MDNIKISLIQTGLYWEDKMKNLAKFDDIISGITVATDVIVLPEMFTTAFTMNPKGLAEPVMGQTMQWMLDKAVEKKSVIAGSLIIEEDGKYFNRLVWMKPDGDFDFYNKRHLFTMSGEQNNYTCGTERKIFEWKGWRFFAQICYDMRFPVFSRYRGDYDCLLYVANWPEIRIAHWKPLAIARAIENEAWLIAVNRVGFDKKKVYHNGHSLAVDPFGNLTAFASDNETVLQLELSASKLKEIRTKLPFLNDRDQFTIK